ncbi:anthranilate synthase component II [Allorhodopirellula solitaria]|uniref:Anthranilate synthase component 2 n=1 Tax=Allorhodopirellula solitaria TaxID=2527987 RepID=A0A5C5YB48_9BACT|nr:aminodeoxychorismate/anthranilate synthase component II [Allorhodopirellula solitaria]TWT72927.1 Anthranilate synthase component 2 [Allorhodopirellula solitaria]
MILLLDNYDSFVHNVARYLRIAGKATRVIRSDEITADQCYQLQPEAIVLSPGPHRPEQAGCCLDVVRTLAGEIPILGICLGHQTIAAAYGGDVVVSPPVHAIASSIEHNSTGIFHGLPQLMAVGRYHSLCVDAATLPVSLDITATTTPADASTSIVMGISDHARCVHGVQFHPESLLTEHGHDLFRNFFGLVDRHHERARRVLGASVGTGRPVAWMSPSGYFQRQWAADVNKHSATVNDTNKPAPLPTLSIASPRTLPARSHQSTGEATQ